MVEKFPAQLEIVRSQPPLKTFSRPDDASDDAVLWMKSDLLMAMSMEIVWPPSAPMAHP